jgi:hypothetical protein
VHVRGRSGRRRGRATPSLLASCVAEVQKILLVESPTAGGVSASGSGSSGSNAGSASPILCVNIYPNVRPRKLKFSILSAVNSPGHYRPTEFRIINLIDSWLSPCRGVPRRCAVTLGVRRAVRRLQLAEPSLLNKISILFNRPRRLADLGGRLSDYGYCSMHRVRARSHELSQSVAAARICSRSGCGSSYGSSPTQIELARCAVPGGLG